MLTSLHIKNFKAWRDTGKIRLAPLTVIFGANSAGKSTIIHAIHYAKEVLVNGYLPSLGELKQARGIHFFLAICCWRSSKRRCQPTANAPCILATPRP